MSWDSAPPFYHSPGGTRDLRLSYGRRKKVEQATSLPPTQNREGKHLYFIVVSFCIVLWSRDFRRDLWGPVLMREGDDEGDEGDDADEGTDGAEGADGDGDDEGSEGADDDGDDEGAEGADGEGVKQQVDVLSKRKTLLFAREKPLYGMLECIRMYLMDRYTTRRKIGARIEDCFCPKIRRKVEKLKSKIGDCMVREAGEWMYQVNTKWNEQYVVDLRDRTCSCRRWMLTGIPCHHGIAAIEMTSENVDDFVDKCYSKECFQKVYEPVIFPVQGPQLWTKTPHPDVVPPEIIKLPGRPKGARQKSEQEKREINLKKAQAKAHAKEKAKTKAITRVEVRDAEDGGKKMSRAGLMSDYKGRKCGEKGHNKRRCPQLMPPGPSDPKATKGSERAKKRKRDKQPQCSMCHQVGHNKQRCPSTVADMYKDPAPSIVADK